MSGIKGNFILVAVFSDTILVTGSDPYVLAMVNMYSASTDITYDVTFQVSNTGIIVLVVGIIIAVACVGGCIAGCVFLVRRRRHHHHHHHGHDYVQVAHH